MSVSYATPVDHPGALQVKIEPDPGGFADQILVGHQAPGAAVFAVVAVVADHHVMPCGHDVEDVVTAVAAALGLGVLADPAADVVRDLLAIAGRQRVGIAAEREAACA